MTEYGSAGVVREPFEVLYAEELAALTAADRHPRPAGWRLSPQAVRAFILGSDGQAPGQAGETVVTKKFYGEEALIDRCIVTLMGNRGLILVGEPGTAKSMLSELLAAAISGDSTNTIQGTAGTTEDQIKYSWNYAMLLADGPSEQALVPSPIHIGFKRGSIVRFEEITRCAPEIQDSLISIMSDHALHVPELGEQAVLFAKKGFNIIATANIRDRGVNEMSSALKRRFNFETVPPIADKDLELELVTNQAQQLLHYAQAPVEMQPDVIDLLVTTFHELREGRTGEGHVVERPSTVMSTAEAVAVAYSAGLDARYFGNGVVQPEHVVRQLLGTAVKDNAEDATKIRQYFDVIVKVRARKNALWRQYYDARDLLKV